MITKTSLNKEKNKNPWTWVPSLYFAQGLPFIIVTTVSIIMYKRMGISNAEIAFYTSWLNLPWVLKPLWSPIVDILKTKRYWIIIMQLIIGAGMACVALTIPAPGFFQLTLAFFWLIAFSSATHDIAIDGFYMIALSEDQQSFFVGIRSTFYRVAMITGQGLIVIIAGILESSLSISPAEVRVIAAPDKFFEETIKVDSVKIKELEGGLRLIANPSVLEISTRPQTKESVNFYTNFTRKFNIMNGFIKDNLPEPDTSNLDEPVGNIGIVKFYLSKKPKEDDEYIVSLDFLDGSPGFNVLEGKSLRFTSKNWNKPAFALIQIDPEIHYKTEALFKARSERVSMAWVFTFGIITILFIVLFIYHNFILPRPANDKATTNIHNSNSLKEFFRSFNRFFEKEKILLMIGFLLLYRLGEAQLIKLASPFMLDSKEVGGLGLTTTDVGFIYGTIGVIALIIGGILGGIAISRKGLKKMIFIMLIAINVPDLLYVMLAYLQPENIFIIYASVAVEQFGYGFGFTALMMYMIYISQGNYQTSHYAIATGFMALGLMLPGMFSGMIQESIGYKMFFIWVCIATIPSFIIARFIPLNPSFGKKKLANTE